METKVRPFNFGPLRGANGDAKITDVHGDTMQVWITVVDRIITAASFITDGIDDVVRCGSVATALIVGKAPCVAATITKEDVLQEAGLSDECGNYALLAIATITKAVENFRSTHNAADANSKCENNKTNTQGNMACGTCGNSSHRSTDSAHSSSCTSSCQSEPESKLANIKHKIAVLSGKGGVGKSTVATNLAFSLVELGYSVGLLDADIHGPSIPTMLDLNNAVIEADSDGIIPVMVGNLKVVSVGFFLRSNADAVIWRGPVKAGVIKQFLHEVKWGQLDFLIIDLPPGTGDEPMSIGQIFSRQDGAVIVTTPQEVASSDVRKSITFCQTMKMSILGIVENMSGFVCPNCDTTANIFGAHGGRDLAKTFNLPLLGEIPIDPAIMLAGDQGKPYVQSHAHIKAAAIFKQIVNSIVSSIERN